MKANLRKIRKKRIFSEEFKRSIVSFFEMGKYNVPALEAQALHTKSFLRLLLR